jgi:hypothetical protein
MRVNRSTPILGSVNFRIPCVRNMRPTASRTSTTLFNPVPTPSTKNETKRPMTSPRGAFDPLHALRANEDAVSRIPDLGTLDPRVSARGSGAAESGPDARRARWPDRSTPGGYVRIRAAEARQRRWSAIGRATYPWRDGSRGRSSRTSTPPSPRARLERTVPRSPGPRPPGARPQGPSPPCRTRCRPRW